MIEVSEAKLRQSGRQFLIAFYAALRTLKLYPLENEQTQKSLDDLAATAAVLIDLEDELELRIAGEFLFVNETRLRLDLDNYASFSHVINTLRHVEVGLMRAKEGVDRRQWQVFAALLVALSARESENSLLSELREKMGTGGVLHITVEPPVAGEGLQTDEAERKEMAKRTYERGVGVTKELVSSARMGRTASMKKVKRAVQGIVDQVLNNETSLVGLTTIRDYDDYTFTHSVNVCIFSISMGRRLGLSKLQLYDLGLAALLHDMGKSRVPLEILNKAGGLTKDEWAIMQAHPWLGVLTLIDLQGYADIPYRSIIVAYEHHMKVNLTGYPKSIRPRTLSIFSKLVSVADVFDAATSRRVYATTPIQPDEILRQMTINTEKLGFDLVLVKALINLLGIYPVGTCVILDTYELAIVHSANPDNELINRPVVRIISSDLGAIHKEGPLVDLGERDADGTFKRSIIKVTDPAKYNIIPSDYFV
jgi:HD-GYP domain-containing protein (c-di-GMP phosphodiesterase class II)